MRMAPDYYFVQPQFGNNELEWSKNQVDHTVIKVYATLGLAMDGMCFIRIINF